VDDDRRIDLTHLAPCTEETTSSSNSKPVQLTGTLYLDDSHHKVTFALDAGTW
jgi:hypothetical protein